jgi:nicotinate-nucleotide adenylyltransferase
MKVGIMGGTFDPVHWGHLIAAEQAREGMGLDEVWFMPVNVPPHKQRIPGADARQRCEMVTRAIEPHPSFRLTDLEIARGGTSYTIDTVKHLKQLYPGNEFLYIIGGDMVQYLPHWYGIEQLVKLIGFLGLRRPGFTEDLEALPEHIRRKVTWVPMPIIDISSTDIRARRRSGQSIRYMVPDSVLYYIEENRLYES